MPFVNVADIINPTDPEGRTYREINNSRVHKFHRGQLIELDNGVRLFIFKLTRDCDGEPLYTLTQTNKAYLEPKLLHGYSEYGMKAVKNNGD